MIARGVASRKTPHSRAFAGETLCFIQNDDLWSIIGRGKVKNVFNSEKMTPEESITILESHQEALQLETIDEGLVG